MNTDEDTNEPRKRGKRNSSDDILKEKDKEIEEIETQHNDLIKLKNERYERLNQKYIALEKEKEEINLEIMNLKDEINQLKKDNKKLIQSSLEKEADLKVKIEEIQKSYNDIKIVYDTWKDIDLSLFKDGGIINIELVEKKIQYCYNQNYLDKKRIESQQEVIKLIEGENIRLTEALNASSKPAEGFFDKVFGKTALKTEICNRNAEIEALKKKQENVITIMKRHQIDMEQRDLKIEELEKIIRDQKENTEKEDELRNKLKEANDTIERRNIAINNMKKQINDKKHSETIYREGDRKQMELERKLNILNLEYEQMEIKYINANEEIERLLCLEKRNSELEIKYENASKEIERLLCLEKRNSELEMKYENARKEIDRLNKLKDSKSVSEMAKSVREQMFVSEFRNTESEPKTESDQVYQQSTEFVTCPNCGNNFESSFMVDHIEICLEEFS